MRSTQKQKEKIMHSAEFYEGATFAHLLRRILGTSDTEAIEFLLDRPDFAKLLGPLKRLAKTLIAKRKAQWKLVERQSESCEACSDKFLRHCPPGPALADDPNNFVCAKHRIA